MNIDDYVSAEDVFREYGFLPVKRAAHAVEYRQEELDHIVYWIPGKGEYNVVLPPRDYNETSLGAFSHKLYHNADMTAFPRRINRGKTPVHYGIIFDFSCAGYFRHFLLGVVNEVRMEEPVMEGGSERI